jgi:outer membrane protein
VYNQALGSQPQIRAGESRIKSAQIGVRIAEAQLLPSLFASGNLNTNYSSTIQNFVSTRRDISQNVVIGGQNVTVVFPGQEILAPSGKKPYFSQIGDNFGYGLGFNLQIPIFDGFSRRIGVERQQLNVENQIITLERTKQQLKSDVQNAIANARAARKQYEAAQKTFEAQKAAFDATEKRFQIGAANGFEFTQSRNQLDQAERDVVVAKYDYLFKMKVVEFYEGKKLSLK